MRRLTRLWAFVTEMDARAWRTALTSFVLFGGVGLLFVFGASLLGLKGPGAVQAWMGAGVKGPWALPMAVGGFTVLAFIGAPQLLLIAAAVLAFGPWAGFAYSWIGTLVSASVGFWLGRRFGARLLRQHAGRGVNDFIDMVGRNGFLASFVVRLAPSAPFIVVNMAAGVTPMRFSAFALATGLGIVPKIALTAFAGHAVVKAVNGGGGGTGRWLSLALALVLWLGAGLAARVWIRRREARMRDGAQADPAGSPPH